MQVCVSAASSGDTPATLTFTLSGGGVADTATVTITQSTTTTAADVTTAGTAALAGATLETTTIADVNDFSLCLIIANGKISNITPSATYTLTVGGTTSGGGALVAGTSNLAVSGQEIHGLLHVRVFMSHLAPYTSLLWCQHDLTVRTNRSSFHYLCVSDQAS